MQHFVCGWMVQHIMIYSSLLPLQSVKETLICEKQLLPVSIYYTTPLCHGRHFWRPKTQS